MTTYNVHLYREMRLLFERIEADTPEAAASIARETLTDDANDIEDCNGEDLGALVDVIGDEDYSQSVTIDFEAERHRKAAAKLLDALRWITRCPMISGPVGTTAYIVSDERMAQALTAVAEAEAAGILPAVTRSERFRFTHEPEENPDRAYVLVDGLFDIKIVRTAEGIVIDAYSKDGIDIVGTMTVWEEDMAEPEPDAGEGA
jgi:hypothetical protein